MVADRMGHHGAAVAAHAERRGGPMMALNPPRPAFAARALRAAGTAIVAVFVIGLISLTFINFMSGCGTEIPGSFCIFIGN